LKVSELAEWSETRRAEVKVSKLAEYWDDKRADVKVALSKVGLSKGSMAQLNLSEWAELKLSNIEVFGEGLKVG
jgi:ribosomal protein L18E